VGFEIFDKYKLTVTVSYSLKDGASSFVKQAQSVTFDLTNDDGRPSRGLTWDKKKKEYVQAGCDNVKMVRTENGTRLPASFRSGRFDEWKERRRADVPRVGEREEEGKEGGVGRRFKHRKVVEAKALDRLRGDYDRRVRQLKKKPEGEGKKTGVKSEMKTVEQVRKGRRVAERRKAKNGRRRK